MDGPEVIQLGNLTVDRTCYEVRVAGRRARLTCLGFDLFFFPAPRPEQVVPVGTLLEQVWGDAAGGAKAKVRVQMCKLRGELGGATRGR